MNTSLFTIPDNIKQPPAENFISRLFDNLPVKIKMLMSAGVEMEYNFDYKNNKFTIKTKNKVVIAEDGKGGYYVAERIDHDKRRI